MILEIAIDAPLRRTFDYRCPPGVDTAALEAGVRVRVPFGRRRLVGILIGVKKTSSIAGSKLKTAIEVLDSDPVFDSRLLSLLMWCAEYYRHPIGEVLAAALPGALRHGATSEERLTRWRLTDLGVQEWSRLSKRATRLRSVAEALAANKPLSEILELPGAGRALSELESRGWANKEHVIIPPTDSSIAVRASDHVLTPEQASALERLLAARGSFRTFLLYGVTGSGKTEVYLRAIEAVVAAHGQALVLVPEISLTPQLVARFQARFAAPLAVLHSGLSDGERLAAWRVARKGVAPTVIGTRSAVFAPMRRLALIVVDEEHDASYKQQEGFRYSARDLAIVRAQRLGIPVVLGSATPSLESLARAKKGPDDLLSLPSRAGSASLPRIALIDLRKHGQSDGIATPTLFAMRAHLERGGQVLLYLNRRGYAPVLFCPSCGWSAVCERCDARMTLHRREQRLRCHHCGAERPVLTECASCRGEMKPVGEGTERIDATVAQLFPQVTVARIDRDNVRRKGDLEAVLEQIQNGSARILIGTQMLTKGHHFPDVSLVVVLNADQGLFGTDFRAAEKLAQSIVQVAGRAGRAERAGEVLIQTEYPSHPLLQSLLSGGYAEFAMRALEERERAHWPPYSRLALLRAEAPAMTAALHFLDVARRSAEQTNSVNVLGPAPAPMPRRAGRYRAQLLLSAATHRPIQALLARWVTVLESSPAAKRVRWSLDVDPAELF